MNEIMSLINNYLKLKDVYKKYNKENLYDVFNLFVNEVFELYDIVSELDYDLITVIEENDKPIDIINPMNYLINPTKNLMEKREEELLNEIADVILTTARLIKEFNLTEPLIEMIGYKYYRQCNREENIKNGR